MADLESLKRQRANFRSIITRIYTFCTTENVTKEQVQARLPKTEVCFEKYQQTQDAIDEIEGSIDEDYRAIVETTYFNIQTIYHQLNGNDSATSNQANENHNTSEIASAMQLLIQQQASTSALVERLTNIQMANTSSPITFASAELQNRSEIKLPPIQLPDFDGNLLDWVRFRDLFEALVHNKANLSNVEKLEYLHTKLKGDALVIIKHLKPTNNNYLIAWELLKKKYNNIDKIKGSYLELLLDQPSMKVPSLTEVKRLYNNTNEAFNAFKALEQGVEQWGGVLLFNIEKKLDSTSR